MDAQELTCSRCLTVDVQVRNQFGAIVDPDGWTVVTISGTPVTNRRLCPDCARKLRQHLATSPGAQALEEERRLDELRERFYKQGYDAAQRDGVEREQDAVVAP